MLLPNTRVLAVVVAVYAVLRRSSRSRCVCFSCLKGNFEKSALINEGLNGVPLKSVIGKI